MKKVFHCKKMMTAFLAAALVTVAAPAPLLGITALAEDEVKITVEKKVEKPVISDISNEYKGLKVSWNKAEGAKGYHVFRRRKTSDPWEEVGTTGEDVLYYLDKDAMKDGGIYTYMIQGFDGDVVSEESATKTTSRFLISRVDFKVKYGQKAARNMAKMINDFRTGPNAWAWNASNSQQVRTQGLGKLAYDYDLEKIAMTRAAEIALKFNHERPNGKTCFSAFDDAGYNYKYAGENIAYGYTTAKAAFTALQETNAYYAGQGHRRNMLSTNYNVCAIGHTKVGGVHYWVQLFAYAIDDSDYRRMANNTQKVSMYVSSDDLSSYKKKFKSLGATVKDYPPSQVSWVSVDAGKREAELFFTKSVGATGYEIYRSENKKSGYKKVVSIIRQLKLSYKDKELKRNKKYFYYIVPYRIAHDTKVYGKKSDIKIVKTK